MVEEPALLDTIIAGHPGPVLLICDAPNRAQCRVLEASVKQVRNFRESATRFTYPFQNLHGAIGDSDPGPLQAGSDAPGHARCMTGAGATLAAVRARYSADRPHSPPGRQRGFAGFVAEQLQSSPKFCEAVAELALQCGRNEEDLHTKAILFSVLGHDAGRIKQLKAKGAAG